MSAASYSFSSLGNRAQPPTIARLMALMLENPKLLSLAAGFTDNHTLPVTAVQAAVAKLAAQPSEPQYLQYGTNQGRLGLRTMLAERLLVQEPELRRDAGAIRNNFFITNGSQQALYLAMQGLCDPGDIVLVDRPSYFVFLEMLTGLGVQARSLPLDAAGRIDGSALRVLLADLRTRGELTRLKAVYFVSYFSNPSARSLDETEKNAVAEALTAERIVVPVLEDAAYRDMYYETPHPARSVLSLPAWEAFPRLYLSTLTKSFASGLKVGYGTCTDTALFAKMMQVKGHHDFGTANFTQAILEQVLADGGLDKQLTVIRPLYLRKMRVLHNTLIECGLPQLGWSWKVPEGGLYLWLKAPVTFDTALDSTFCRACVEAGVLYVPGDLCFGDAVPRNCVRLSFGVLGEEDLAKAGQRFVAVAKKLA